MSVGDLTKFAEEGDQDLVSKVLEVGGREEEEVEMKEVKEVKKEAKKEVKKEVKKEGGKKKKEKKEE